MNDHMALRNRALKVGVFYDGGYFTHVTNYYNYVHPHRRRIHIGGLHDLVQHKLAELEGTRPSLAHIIDAHFFRGRFSAKEANEKPNQIFNDRVFDEVLMYNGVQTHYLPVREMRGRKAEKGIDVLMALETYELAMHKRYDVVVLIASDSDHVPLVRKLHALGCKTMLLAWDFEYTDNLSGELVTTRVSRDLWNMASYPLEMCPIIDDGLKEGDPLVLDLFVQKESVRHDDAGMDLFGNADTRTEEPRPEPQLVDEERHTSTVMSKFHSYGFIRYPDNNLFFMQDDLEGVLFGDLQLGDPVEFNVALNNKGQRVAKHIRRALPA